MTKFRNYGLISLCLLSLTAVAGCASTGDGAGHETASLKDVLISPKDAEKKAGQALESAKLVFQSGEYAEAEILFSNVLELQPGNVEARYGLGEIYLATGRAVQAIPFFSGLVANEEYTDRAWQGSGLAYLSARDFNQAKIQLTKAVELNEKLWRAWNGLGIVHDSLQDFENAEKAYLTAISLNPKASAVYNNLGMSYMTQKRYSDAEKQFVTALSTDPGSRVAEINLRFSLAWQGKYVNALSGLKEEHWAESLNNVGYIALQKDDLVQAEAFLTRAIELNPSFHKVAHRNLRMLHEQNPSFNKGAGADGILPSAKPAE